MTDTQSANLDHPNFLSSVRTKMFLFCSCSCACACLTDNSISVESHQLLPRYKKKSDVGPANGANIGRCVSAQPGFSFFFFLFFSLTICLRADSMVGTRRGSVEIRNHLDFAYKHCEWACRGSHPHFDGPRTLQRVARSCYLCYLSGQFAVRGQGPCPMPHTWPMGISRRHALSCRPRFGCIATGPVGISDNTSSRVSNWAASLAVISPRKRLINRIQCQTSWNLSECFGLLRDCPVVVEGGATRHILNPLRH